MKRHAQQGIALVMTLIMLTVISFLAITFLSVSRRERGSVTTARDQTVARLAADAAVARVEIELLAPMLAATNGQLFDLLVSTNYINQTGFTNDSASPYNVNYDFQRESPYDALTPDQLQRNVANLLFSPRPPVYVRVSSDRTQPMDFRFYLDLNRNRRFDTNGWQPVLSGNAINPWFDTNGNPVGTFDQNNVLRTNFVGDPEWVGILERPELPHSPSNRFVARYAFVAVPAGRTLDINYIHNLTKRSSEVGSHNEGFLRNQGVGTWEINLAAFLVDLDTNVWNPLDAQYSYDTNRANPSSGRAFYDALDILTNRYQGTITNLQRANQIFSNSAAPLVFNNIDDYSDGELMVTTTNIDEGNPPPLEFPDNPTLPWSGAPNPKHFFNPQELFERTNFNVDAVANFADHLAWTGTNDSSYGRYAYYRMLSALGTDTGPEPPKINVNYMNVDESGRINNTLTTNLFRWTNSLMFFTNAADRLIRAYTTNWLREDPTNYLLTFNFTNALYNGGSLALGTNVMDMTNTLSLTNIPVWINNKFVYSSSIHRLLQVAANIYDSSAGATNGMEYGIGYPAWPSVFKPIFHKKEVFPADGGPSYYNIYIVGYTNVTDGNNVVANPARDLYDPGDVFFLDPTNNIYGVPLVIGAKKGYPNFNEYAFENSVTLARRLEFRRRNLFLSPDDANNPVAYTNQMYTLACSNVFAVEAWNSYSNVYPRPLRLIVSNDTTFVLYSTNILSNQKVILQSNRFTLGWVTNFLVGEWTNYPAAQGGAIPEEEAAKSFQIPLTTINNTNFSLISTNAMIIQSPRGFGDFPTSENVADHPFPNLRWWLSVSSRMRYILEDTDSTPENGSTRPYLVDYVSFNIHPPDIDVTSNLTYRADYSQNLTQSSDPWITNRNALTGIPIGIQNQIDVCMGTKQTLAEGKPTDAEITAFKYQLVDVEGTNQPGNLNRSNIFQAPYTPETSLYDNRSYQANDPLVHYTMDDLTDLATTQNILKTTKNPVLANVGRVNDRYLPWDRKDSKYSSETIDYNPAFKDPLVYRSDDWDFPTNILPNVGWLGRIHRGTPWQTIYLKSPDVGTNWVQDNVWQHWVGNSNGVEAVRMRPAEDWKLFDFFTAAVHENATHGQLSVNQKELAAWSAVLAGVVALNNPASPVDLLIGDPIPTAPLVINPAFGSPDTPVGRIVAAINNVRATNTMFKGTFQHLGEICSVPELTVSSPFLDTVGTDQARSGITEEMYERIPQQIMSLLKLGEPRFVIYAYGQALHPAPRSIVTSGQLFGLCTNYQITAEVATRTVLHFEGAPKPGDTNSLPRVVVDSFNVLPPD